MSVGANIKKRRFELGMSQEELAAAMGYKSRSTIAKIEAGVNDVSQKKLAKLAAALDTTVENLIAGYSHFPHAISSVFPDSPRKQSPVLVLAGGKSSRNQQNIPNQFIHIRNKPVIVYCLEAYQAHPSIDAIYVVCLSGWESIVRDYAEQYGITKLKGLIPAGSSGIVSVKNGVQHLSKLYASDSTIVIQESTRPMVNADHISKLLQACSETESATICRLMRDYVQFSVKDDIPHYIDRNTLLDLQSPEAHRLSLLRAVFEKAENENHPLTETCCTMLLYNLGYPINFIEGGGNNIKIVRQEDIAIFSALLNARQN